MPFFVGVELPWLFPYWGTSVGDNRVDDQVGARGGQTASNIKARYRSAILGVQGELLGVDQRRVTRRIGGRVIRPLSSQFPLPSPSPLPELIVPPVMLMTLNEPRLPEVTLTSPSLSRMFGARVISPARPPHSPARRRCY